MNILKTIISYFLFLLYKRFNNIKHKPNIKRPHPSSFKKEIYDAIKKNGFYVFDNYLDELQCSQLIKDINKAFKDYSFYVQKRSDKRLFGIENTSKLSHNFYADNLFEEIANLINGENTYCAFTLAGKLGGVKGGSSGGDWHRDAFFCQFKSMIYLSEVNDQNGAFEILPESHRLLDLISQIKSANLKYNQYRLSENQVKKIENQTGKKRKTIFGKAGTVILFNSSTIHRGSPIIDGERYSLTNYYFPRRRSLENLQEQFFPVLKKDKVFK